MVLNFMNISEKFHNFCNNIRIKQDVVDTISYRNGRITRQLNKDFWHTESETSHSLYVGSYGRDTEPWQWTISSFAGSTKFIADHL